MLLSPGTRLGPYEILDAIGAGGMGQVYKALDTRLGREVAVKILPDTFMDQGSRDRFLREARAASALSHPGICAIYDIGESGGRPHLVMELLSGQTLKQRIGGKPLDLATILSFGIQIADALDAAHSKGIVHRDIKPANIMIGDRGQVKILDFGLAMLERSRTEGAGDDSVALSVNLTMPGTTVGTYAYMSPEQARGQADARTDLWSLGVVLYEMATGTVPFEGSTGGSILESVFTKNPEPLRTRNTSIPAELDRIIDKALEKDRDTRYQSAADMRADLKRVEREMNSGQSRTVTASGSRVVMTAQAPNYEMASVLFMDIVSYSLGSIDDQTELLTILQKLVRESAEYQQASAMQDVISLPTGDGMALVFLRDPVSPVKCALEVAGYLQSHPEINLRMGVHTGPVRRHADIKQEVNVVGGGINMAQRVMDCGDAGHILLSRNVAEVLQQLRGWSDCLEDLGFHEVKHGVKVHLYNLCKDGLGNPALPRKIAAGRALEKDRDTIRQESAIPAPVSKVGVTTVRPPRGWLKYGIAAVTVVVAAGGIFWWQTLQAKPLTDKDIVVLADFANSTGDSVFDGALKSALASQLDQSPFLKIKSDEEMNQALQLAGRKREQGVSRQIAREVCERDGDKAMIAGSIASLGKTYLIAIEAVNCASGATLAREHEDAEDKDHVLKALSTATAKLRGKLGESSSSIAKTYTEFKDVTTSSLEAFKAYSLGEDQKVQGLWGEAIPFYEHATALDPNFAMAYARMSVAYKNMGERGKDIENANKAFRLVDRVSEREKLYISGAYHLSVTRDFDKLIAILQLYHGEYPRDSTPLVYLGGVYSEAGEFEKALQAYQEATRIEPRSGVSYINLGLMYIALNKFDEAKQNAEKAIALKWRGMDPHLELLKIAYFEGDDAAAQKEIRWALDNEEAYRSFSQQALEAEYHGQWHKARELRRKSSDLARARGLLSVVAGLAASDALGAAILGDCGVARNQAKAAIVLDPDMRNVKREATALALCGDAAGAQKLAEESAKQYPNDTLNNAVGIPSIHAALEFKRGEAEKVIEILKSAQPYDRSSAIPSYLRGLAFLHARKGSEAAAEFQRIIDNKGAYWDAADWETAALLCALSHVGVARAATIAGDTAWSKKAYQDFLALWKDADPDLPIFAEAGKELAALH